MEALPENLDIAIPTTDSSIINTSDQPFGVVDSEALFCNFEVSSIVKRFFVILKYRRTESIVHLASNS